MRILIVEDDANLNRQLAEVLKEAGYVVDQAYDGEEGHYLGDAEPYDAVILDIGLPEMDGITVVEKWRGDGKTMVEAQQSGTLIKVSPLRPGGVGRRYVGTGTNAGHQDAA